MFFDETIAAISTPHGRGGIAVIRISGRDAISIAGKVFIPFGRQFHGRIEELPDRYAAYGKVMSEGKRLDDCIATVFRAPDSYTGEDVVEISCHGGVLLTQTILGELFSAGAVQAGRGEFTRRAFVSGKLSLSQAESVIGLIDAESRAQLRLQSSQRQGVLTAALDGISKRIMWLVTSIYAYIDFPDEDMTDVSAEEMTSELRGILGELDSLENTYRTGHAVAEGIKTVIAGLPNTGKSSLLNLLLGSRRAIVTDIEGTTRDAIEETAFAGEVMLRLCDTAGIRESDDRVEMLGVEIAQQRMKEAQLILAVFDASRPLDEKAREFASSLKMLDCEKIIVLNKSDLGEAAEEDVITALAGTDGGRIVRMCCADFESEEGRRSRGLICAKIEELFTDGSLDYDSDAVIVNARQYADVHNAAEAVKDALGALDSMQTQDIAGLDLERALTALAEADGRAVTDEIVDGIFHNFCVGK